MSRSRDALAGGFLFLVGLCFAVESVLRLDIGTAGQMGPGYYPILLSLLIMPMGVAIAFGRSPADAEPGPMIDLRELLLLGGAPMLFGLTIERLGFVPATFLAVFAAAMTDRQAGLVPTLVTSVALTLFCVLVFIYGVGMPYQLFAF